MKVFQDRKGSQIFLAKDYHELDKDPLPGVTACVSSFDGVLFEIEVHEGFWLKRKYGFKLIITEDYPFVLPEVFVADSSKRLFHPHVSLKTNQLTISLTEALSSSMKDPSFHGHSNLLRFLLMEIRDLLIDPYKSKEFDCNGPAGLYFFAENLDKRFLEEKEINGKVHFNAVSYLILSLLFLLLSL
jgi:ubiquitin-protein ligase